MKKSDLKTGMVAVQRDGNKAMVLLNTANGDILSGNTSKGLNAYTDSLKNNVFISSDIVEVWQPQSNYAYLSEGVSTYGANLIWRREEIKQMTVSEISKALGYTVKVVE